MSLAAHGPSPWEVVYDSEGSTLAICDANGVVVAQVNMPRDTSPAEWSANASLIANAPAMLALMVKILARSMKSDDHPAWLVQEVEALVAKAKRETP